MHDNEAQGNEMLIHVGVAIYALAIVLQTLSFWANAYVFGWMTLKYVALMGLGLLPIVLLEGRARAAKALGAFFAVLALSGSLTYSESSVDGAVSGGRRALEARAEAAAQDYEARRTSEYRDYQYADALLSGVQTDLSGGKNHMDAKEWTAKVAELKADRDAKKKAYDEKVKAAQTLDAAKELTELRHDLEFRYTNNELNSRRSDLYSAKALDFFILLGAALFVIGCLLPGEYAVPPYSPPAPPVKQP